MFPAHNRSKTKYIGRKEEMDILEGLLEETLQGRGHLVLVEGEAGIGKTRLIEEMKALPSFSNFIFLMGRCLYFKDTDIYLPFKEMFNQYKQIMRSRERETDIDSPFISKKNEKGTEEKDGSTPGEEDFVPMSLIPAEIEVEEEEEEEMVVEGLLEFDKLSRFIFKLSAEAPLCLFIDDLHWADPPSIKFLQFLAQNIRDHPIMIICTYRPEDLFWGEDHPHPLADPLKRLAKDKLYVPITLKRLSREDTDSLISSILKIERVPTNFSKILYKRTNGNPFFVEEVIYSLMERNIINPEEPDWAETLDPTTISLPTTLKDVILRRLHWLKANSISVVRLASVSGTKVTFDIVKEALEMPEEEILEALEELVQAKFIIEVSEDESFEFENPVIQEVIYSELNHSRRRFLHNKMANVLSSKYSSNPTVWGNIAIHYYKGKDFEKALYYLTKAASYFQKISPHKALEYLHMVLDCTERLPKSDSVKAQNMGVLLEISDLCLQIGDWTRALNFAEKSLNLATVLRAPENIVKAKLILAEVCRNRGDFDKAEGYYQEIVNNTSNQSMSELFARAYMGLGYILWRRGEYPRSLEMFSKSLQFAKNQNNLNTIGTLYLHIGNVFNHRGDPEKALDYYKRGIKHLETAGNMLEASRGYNNLGNVYIQMNDVEEAEKNLETSLERSKERGRHDFWWPIINRIMLRAQQGDHDGAEGLFEQVMEQIKDKDDRMAMGISHMYLGHSRSLAGQTDEAETLLVRAVSLFESLSVPYELGRSKYYLAQHYLKQNRFEDARNLFGEAYNTFKMIGAKRMAEAAREKLLELRKGEDFI